MALVSMLCGRCGSAGGLRRRRPSEPVALPTDDRSPLAIAGRVQAAARLSRDVTRCLGAALDLRAQEPALNRLGAQAVHSAQSIVLTVIVLT
jgi:hypothetical protein